MEHEFSEMLSHYQTVLVNYELKREKLKRCAERAQKSLDKQKYPHYIQGLLQPLAERLMSKFFPDRDIEFLGPFGLCNEVSIWFVRKGISEKDKLVGDNTLSITFIPFHFDRDFELRVRNTDIDTGKFDKNTIGAMNGMNHPDIKIPKNASLNWFKKWIR